MSTLRSASTVGIALIALVLTFVACAGTESFFAGSAAHAQSSSFDWHHHVFRLPASGYHFTLTARCPPGERVVSGGYQLFTTPHHIGNAMSEFVRGTHPTSDLSGWQVVYFREYQFVSEVIVVSAACTTAAVT